MSFFISSAIAQTADATAAASTSSSALLNMLPIVGFGLIFYFLIWRPQSKRAKELKSLVDSLTKGDEILTTSGMLGKINRVDDHYVALQAVAAVLPKGTIKSI
jgi:preprotein translocase subunit YajC